MPAKTELERLAAVGAKFSEQWRGRKPGVLSVYVADVVARLERPSFDALLVELRYEALRRRMGHATECPILEIDTESETLAYRDARGREHDIGFGHLQNLLTRAKKKFILSAKA